MRWRACESTFPTRSSGFTGAALPFSNEVMEKARNRRGWRAAFAILGPKRLEELVREIEACDVGVIPNQRNPFTDINTPTRIFEYLALGKPVIAPRTPGIQDYFDPESLFFFEAGDAGDLARKSNTSIPTPARRPKLRSAASRSIWRTPGRKRGRHW